MFTEKSVTRLMFACSLGISLISHAPLAHADESSELAGIINSYLDETLHCERFEMQHHMKYVMHYEFPDGPPPIYPVKVVYEHWAQPPKFRFEAILGPYEPIKQAATRQVAVWDGNNEVNIRYDDKGLQNTATVDRVKAGSDIGRSNRYLAFLGIPRTRAEMEEARNGSYFLRGSITVANGYSMVSELDQVRGISCHVIEKAGTDRIWMSAEKPIRLIRRDGWKSRGTPSREIIECENYLSSGLPAKITRTTYVPVNKVGESSKILAREIMALEQLDFRPQDAKHFVLEFDQGATVLDVDTLNSFHVEDDDASPFEKTLRLHQNPERTAATSWMFDANLLIIAILALLYTLRKIRDR